MMAHDGDGDFDDLQFTLTKQDESADDDTWNIAASGAVCLGLVSNTVTINHGDGHAIRGGYSRGGAARRHLRDQRYTAAAPVISS